ncbi:hypothetical protein NPIL_79351 [Nephila pilipes]|uniref:Uncharacterized protein n=1 Tax=Nephila pilipes TaxID=299642 RepID=A0A8X6TQ77_NEPPI|nr:hypothetical protein NPIL_79351 [Nephila pilipes]
MRLLIPANFSLVRTTSVSHIKNICQLTKSISSAFVGILTTLGADDPKTIGDFSTRSMRNNFDFYNGVENADLLGSQFTLFFEDSSRKYVKEGDPTSKFPAITEGIVVFLKSIGPLTYEEGLTVSISYESEWLLKAVETPYSTKLFYSCSFEADGDPN